jgi:hypothetical protein
MLDPGFHGDPWPIPRLYASLSPFKVGSGDGDGRRPPGFRSTMPINSHQVSLADPRSKANGSVWIAGDGRVHHEPSHGLLHAPTVLGGWLATVLVLDEPPRPWTVDALAGGLLAALEDAMAQDWIADMVDELRECHRQLRTALQGLTGEHRPMAIGRCAVEDVDGVRCDAALYAPRHGDAVACRRCGAYWPRETWMDAALEMVAS